MLEFKSLYSGSTGNSLYVQSENTKLLIDTGVSAKKIEAALSSFAIDANDIDGILVTHEHIDHVQSLGTFSKKYNIPVFANTKTWDAMPIQKDKIKEENQKNFAISDKFSIGDLSIEPFSIPHDAANPCGFNIYKDATKISIATDLGHMSKELISSLEGSRFVMLESNYDPEILKCCSYPYPLKSRIAGPNGHLPNHMAGKTIAHLLTTGLKNVMLGHLSKENNFPELAYKTVLEELMESNFNENDIKICVAGRSEPSKLITIAN